MSARAMAWAWAILPMLSKPVEKLVLLRLADRADPQGKCWPGHQTTSEDLGVSETSVKTSILSLKQHGLIQVEAQKIGGRDASNLYLLQIEGEGANFAPRGAIDGKADFDNCSLIRGAKFGPRGAKIAPESVIRENLTKERARTRVRYEIDEHGIHHDPADIRDHRAILRISEFRSEVIKEAVVEARALDGEGRAFPSSTLKILLLNTRTNVTSKPAWSRGAFTNIHKNDLNSGGEDELIINV